MKLLSRVFTISFIFVITSINFTNAKDLRIISNNDTIKFDVGIITDTSYTNSYLNISFKLKDSWHIRNQAEINKLAADGIDLLSNNNKASRDYLIEKMKIKESIVFFMAKESEFGSPGDINSSFILSGERTDQLFMMSTVKEFLEKTKSSLKNAGIYPDNTIYKPVKKDVFADELFWLLEINVPLFDGTILVQKYLAKEIKDYYIYFTLLYNASEDNSELEYIIDSIIIKK